MKKLVFVLMACAAIFAVSCNKDDSSKKKSGDKTKYESPINIDGVFTDWADLDAAKTSSASCNEKSAYLDLKVLKAYCDELYLYLYVEYDFKKYVEGEETIAKAKIDFVFNCDNDQTTGGYSGTWDVTPCLDVLAEGYFIFDEDYTDYEPGIFKWTGDPNDAGWLWDGGEIPDSKFLKAAKFVGDFERGAGELQFDLYQYPWGLDNVKETFTIGAFMCVNGDDATGALPNKASTDAVSVNKHLEVHMNK